VHMESIWSSESGCWVFGFLGKKKPKSTKQHRFRLFQNPKRIDNAMDPKPIKNQWFCGQLFDFFDLIENCEYA
jgi:hypothetical protein